MLASATVAALLLPAAAYFWLIHHYGANVVWLDQWFDINLINQSYSHTLTLSSLWAQHNENRIFFPNLIVLALASTTHFTITTEEYFSGVLLLVATGLVVFTHKRRSPSTPLIYYLPAVAVMFTFVQCQDTLWGFQMAWYLVMLAMAVAFCLLDNPRLGAFVMAGACAAAVVGSFSSLQGLLIWPAGLVLLYHRRRSPRLFLAWIVVGVATGALYFYHFSFQSGGSDPSFVLHQPGRTIEFFFTGLGLSDSLVGVVVLVIAIWILIFYGVRRGDGGGGPLGVALIVFGLLFAAITTESRAHFGVTSSYRYVTFDLLVLVGCYLAVLGRPTLRWKPKPPQRATQVYRDTPLERWLGLPTATVEARPLQDTIYLITRLVIVAAIALSALTGVFTGLDSARGWRALEVRAATVTLHIETEPNRAVKSALYPNPYFDDRFIRHMAEVMKVHRLSLFNSASAASSSASETNGGVSP
jgi:hypothetical protein